MTTLKKLTVQFGFLTVIIHKYFLNNDEKFNKDIRAMRFMYLPNNFSCFCLNNPF